MWIRRHQRGVPRHGPGAKDPARRGGRAGHHASRSTASASSRRDRARTTSPSPIGGKNSNARSHGIPDEYFSAEGRHSVQFRPQARIRWIVDEIRKVVAIGTNVVERLFAKGVDPVGKDVRVKDVVMKVVGVFHDKSNRGQDSERVYIPLIDLREGVWRRRTGSTTSGCGPQPGVDGFELEKKVVDAGQAPPRRVARRQPRHQLLQHGRAHASASPACSSASTCSSGSWASAR